MGIITSKVIEILREIEIRGDSVNMTNEIQNAIVNISLADVDVNTEEIAIEHMYNKFIEPYAERQALEKTHYDRLKADFVHELTRHQWFTNHDKIYGIEELAEGVKHKISPECLYRINEQKKLMIDKMKKLDNFSGRRNLIFSQDCISLIQLLVRDKGNVMNVVIRSSDAFKLLPIDILEMIKLYYYGTDALGIKRKENDKIMFLISSCHTYESDADKIKYLLKWSK